MKFVALVILRFYKRWISPALPPSCRYVPTCSDYAMEAIERYGALRGGWMAAWRLLRCHPFVRGGYDPVVKTACDHVHAGWSSRSHPSDLKTT
jgi:uncharacterized protein